MMSIYYSLIARGTVFLCDHATRGGNFQSVAHSVLDGQEAAASHASTARVEKRVTYVSGQHHFHVLNEDLTYLCVTDNSFDGSLAFRFLSELKRQLVSLTLLHRAKYAGDQGLKNAFAGVMKREMQRYSSAATGGRGQSKNEGDHIDALEDQLMDVQAIIIKDIEKVMTRGQALDDISERSSLLASTSTEFHHASTRLRRKMFCRNVKLWIGVSACVCGVVVLLAVVIVVAVLVNKNKHSSNTPS